MTRTRRQELEDIADGFCMHHIGVTTGDQASRDLLDILANVEREVWMTVRKDLERDPLIKCFLERNFWDAHHVDLIWRHNGKDKVYQADWIKSIWYKCKEQQAEVGE